ncbi:MAG: neutral/alkaline non-lysosomal ceramidase N-terminal domain-containing protein [Thermomicrobiales bacterium]
MASFRVGSATADITPDWSLTLAGFAARTKPSEGVAQPLQMRVAVLESETDDGVRERAVVVTVDLLWWGPQQVRALRAEIATIAGAPEANVMFSASHTHSGPQASTRASAMVGVADPRFLDLLQERTLTAVDDALNDLEPVTVARVTGEHALGFNRRLDLNPDGAEDPTLTVVSFRRADGRPKTLFVHYTCHPVITQEYVLSGEFCGVAMSALEADLGVNALYLQGCCGDINPDVSGERRTVRGTNVDVEREGMRLAGSVRALLAGDSTVLEPVPLNAEHEIVELPFSVLPTDEELEAVKDAPGVQGEWSRALLAHPEWRTPSIPLHLQRLDIADGLSLLAMDGEIVVEYGLRVRKNSGDAVLPMGYANGMTGYVPTARQISEGGYEAGGAIPYFFLPAPFDPAVETVLGEALDRLVAASAG